MPGYHYSTMYVQDRSLSMTEVQYRLSSIDNSGAILGRIFHGIEEFSYGLCLE